jgi:septum formation protein
VESQGPVRLVLASQSPRRIEMLKLLGVTFDTMPSEIDETTELTDAPELVEFLAQAKAQHIANQLALHDGGDTLVLGADTVVVLGNDILGKPTTREHAYQMLMRMSGRHHRVLTGVCVLSLRTGESLVKHEVSSVFFRSLDPAEVRTYAKTEEPMDKAGAYALQGAASAFVDKVDGCYSNIIGLPMPLTVKMLRQSGLKVLGMP